MIRRSDVTVSDEDGTPTGGIYITVKNTSGTLLALFNDDSSPLANPFQSGVDGTFTYNIADGAAGTITEEYRLSLGETPRNIETIILGDVSGGGSAVVSVNDFGATGNGSTDDSAAFVAAIAALKTAAVNSNGTYKASAKLTALPGHYYLGTTTLDITHTFIFECDGTGMAGVSYPVKLRWAAGTTGIRVQRYNTSGLSTVDGVTHFGGDGCIFRGLWLVGGFAGTEGEFHGFHLKARAGIEHCKIENFAGDGIYANASAGVGSPGEGNANLGYILGGSIQGCRNGLFFDGADTNIWTVIGLDLEVNRRWGIFDSSFLGNSYSGCHADANGFTTGVPPSIVSYLGNRYAVKHGQETGASTNAPSGTAADNTWWYYMSAGGTSPTVNINTWVSGTTYRSAGSYRSEGEGNAGNLFSGCYHEGGQAYAQIDAPALVVGGSMTPFVKGVPTLVATPTDLKSAGGGLRADKSVTAFGSAHQFGPQSSGTVTDTTFDIFSTNSVFINFWRIVAGVPTYDGFLADIGGTAYLTSTFGIHFRYNNSETANIVSTGLDLVSGKTLTVAGTQVVTARQTGTPADATDLATALTLVNALKAKLITHGLIS